MNTFIPPANTPNHIDRINEVWLFISEDETGEGLCSAELVSGILVPMMGADINRVNSLKEVAKKMATMGGKRIKLIKFSVREDLETYEP